MQLAIAPISTPLGEVRAGTCGEHLCALALPDRWEPTWRHLSRHAPKLCPCQRQIPRPIADAIAAYFAGELAALDRIPVRLFGTAFQREVWRALRAIPAGQTRTYTQLARTVGRPGAVRAAGAANGQNPIAIVIPCHRVIQKDGAVGGYAGGLARKRWLLAHEAGQGRLDLAQMPTSPASPERTR